jgi:hypothetical protein
MKESKTLKGIYNREMHCDHYNYVLRMGEVRKRKALESKSLTYTLEPQEGPLCGKRISFFVRLGRPSFIVRNQYVVRNILHFISELIFLKQMKKSKYWISLYLDNMVLWAFGITKIFRIMIYSHYTKWNLFVKFPVCGTKFREIGLL